MHARQQPNLEQTKIKKYLFYWIAFEKKFNLLMHSGTFKVQKKTLNSAGF